LRNAVYNKSIIRYEYYDVRTVLALRAICS